jgi:MFS family permease
MLAIRMLGEPLYKHLHALVRLRPAVRGPIRSSQWRILFSATAAIALTAPGQTVGLSVFVDPLITDLHLTRTQISTAYLIGTLTGAAALPWVGRAVDRWGVRRPALIIAAGFGAALIGLSWVTDLFGLAAGYVGVRLAGQGALTLVATTAVALWFDRRRGTASGVSTAVGGMGISLTPVLTELLISEFGWRTAWTVQGVAIWVILVPIALFGLRGAPPVREHAGTRHGGQGFGPGEALRAPLFWVIAAGVAASGMLITALSFHQISLLAEHGMSATEAAANFLPQTVAGLAASLVIGPLCDRFSARPMIVACMALLAAGMLWTPQVAGGARALVFALLLGAAGSAIRTVEVAVIPRHFGVAHLGAIRGIVHFVTVASSAFGPIVLALGQEASGSYTPVVLSLAIIPATIAVAALVVPLPQREAV